MLFARHVSVLELRGKNGACLVQWRVSLERTSHDRRFRIPRTQLGKRCTFRAIFGKLHLALFLLPCRSSLKSSLCISCYEIRRRKENKICGSFLKDTIYLAKFLFWLWIFLIAFHVTHEVLLLTCFFKLKKSLITCNIVSRGWYGKFLKTDICNQYKNVIRYTASLKVHLLVNA